MSIIISKRDALGTVSAKGFFPMIIGKMSGMLAPGRSNGKKCESNGKMSETTLHT